MVTTHRLLPLLLVLLGATQARGASDILLVRTDGVSATFRGSAEAPGGERLLVGTVSGTSGIEADTFVMRLDARGRADAPILLGGDAMEDARDVVALDDGWLVTGIRTTTGTLLGSEPWLTFLAPDGAPRRAAVIGLSAQAVTESQLARSPAGGAFWAVQAWDVSTGLPFAWLARLGPTGTIAWERRIDADLRDVSHVVPLRDGGCALVGLSREEDGWLTGRLMEIAPDGSPLRLRMLRLDDGHADVNHVREEEPGVFIAYGTHSANDVGSTWMARIHAGGIAAWQVIAGGARGFDSLPRPDGTHLLCGQARGPQPRLHRTSLTGEIEAAIALPGNGVLRAMFARDDEAWALGSSNVWEDGGPHAAMLLRVDTGRPGRRWSCLPETDVPIADAAHGATLTDLPIPPSSPLSSPIIDLAPTTNARILTVERPCVPLGRLDRGRGPRGRP